MKTRIITTSMIGLLIALSTSIQPLQAQMQFEAPTQPQSPAISDSITHPLNWEDRQGSKELQEKVLMRINQAVVEGTLSAADAAELKSRLNQVSDQESWYKTENTEIPAQVTESNTKVLGELNTKIASVPRLSADAENALHTDIDEMISKALAKNHISSSDAEKYYMRLAQVESNIENARRSQTLSTQWTSLAADLRTLKTELQPKQ